MEAKKIIMTTKNILSQPDKLERDIIDLFLSHLLDVDINLLDTFAARHLMEFEDKILGKLEILMYQDRDPKPLTIFYEVRGRKNMYEFEKNDHDAIGCVLRLIHKSKNSCDMCVFPYTKIK